MPNTTQWAAVPRAGETVGSSTTTTPHGAGEARGWWGIVIVIASHLNFAILTVLLICNGVLHVALQNEFQTNNADTAIVQSLLVSAGCFSGALGGLMTSRLGCRPVAMIGSGVITVGLFCSAWAQRIAHLYVTSVFIGVGFGMSIIPPIIIVAQYFTKNYGMVNALSYSGCGTGFMAGPLLIQYLLDKYGWRGTLGIFSAITANNIALAALYRPNRRRRRTNDRTMSTRGEDSKQSPAVDRVPPEEVAVLGCGSDVTRDDETVETELSAMAGSASLDGNTVVEHDVDATAGETKGGGPGPGPGRKRRLMVRLCTALGVDIMFKCYPFTLLCIIDTQVNIPRYGLGQFVIPLALRIGVTPSAAAVLLSFMGAGNLIGRLSNGVLIGRRLPVETVGALCLLLNGLAMVVLAKVPNYAVLMVATFLHGFGLGNFKTLRTVLVRSYVGLKRMPKGTGIVFFFGGIGSLIGPIITGRILDVADSYETAFSILSGFYFFTALQSVLLYAVRRFAGNRTSGEIS